MKRRLERITLPYLKSDMSIKDFADSIDLTSSRVSSVILRDLNAIHFNLFKDNDFELRKSPKTREDRDKWIERIEKHSKNIDSINGYNRKISDLTVKEFEELILSTISKLKL